jgi:hypothetical protein
MSVTRAKDRGNMKFYKLLLRPSLILLLAGVLLLILTSLRTLVASSPSDLFRRHILDPLPSSVTDIRADQTRSVFGYGYVFRFRISRGDLGLLLASRPFARAVNVRFADGVLSWDWYTGGGVSASVYASRWNVPEWFTPEKWNDAKAYATYDHSPEGTTDMQVLLHNETAGEAYLFVSHGR